MFYYTLSRWSARWRTTRHHAQAQSGLRFLQPDARLPHFVRACPVTMRILPCLRHLEWETLNDDTQKGNQARNIPHVVYIASYLVKLDAHLTTMGQLRRYLIEHPALIWALGYPLVLEDSTLGFNPEATLPSRRQFSRILSSLDNSLLQRLFDEQVKTLKSKLPASFGRIISLDTKHIIAWTKENNPKAYIKGGRYHKEKQATGDPDCKVGCKRRRNIYTPTKEGKPASRKVSIGEYYWGYASGAVVTKVPGKGEFVLAELTQPFDKGDTTYFFPLMEMVEKRLGFKPKYGTADAAYDAFYVYDYFHDLATGGMAAVPFSQPQSWLRQFDEEGLPLCQAGFAMPLRKTYMDRTKAIIPHERAFYACPLLFPQPTGASCPIEHKQWPKGGCSAQMSTSIGARIRHQLDRESLLYKQIYKERTAVERIFAQAVHFGIERPKLRNQQSITNINTLIYLLINIRFMQRLFADR